VSRRERLIRAAPEKARPELERFDGLAAAIDRALADGAAAWPMIAIEDDDFLRWIGERLPEEGAVDAIAGLHAADLLLACACARGLPAALTLFDQRYLSEAGTALERSATLASVRDEVLQQLRQKLLVTDGGRPGRIAEYAGRGPLASWVRSAAIRTGLNATRGAAKAPGDDAILEVSGGTPDPELDYMKRRYTAEFQAAFQAALEGLTPRERNLLRMHTIDGLNLDQIGAVHRVHRATVARWIAAARESLLERTRKGLEEKLKLQGSEFESLMGLVRSQLDLSIHSFLKKSS